MNKKEGYNEFRQSLKLRIYNWTVRLVKELRTVSKHVERSDLAIVDQLIRSSTSVGANYVEAIASPTQKDFRKFLSYSLKSGNESKYWLALMRDVGIMQKESIEKLIQEIQEITLILGKSVSTMYKND